MKKQKAMLMTDCADLYCKAKRRYDELLQIKNSKEMTLEKMPPGKIHVSKTPHGVQYYMRQDSTDKTGKYIPKSETSTIRQYLQKAYDEKILRLVSQEIQSLKRLLGNSENPVNKIRRAYSDFPQEVKNYITPIDVSDEDFIRSWLSIPYKGKAIPEYLPILETNQKERVRSKSELNIAKALAEQGSPYKYECPLQLSNGMIIYPDFTVLDVKRRKVWYWEHRGMMDDKDYARNAVLKMKSYLQSGICLGKELIISEETGTNPLGTNEINEIIKTYFG